MGVITIHVILLSGGSGKRLWPLSNDVRSKQFLRLFPQGDEGYISMAQRVYHQICQAIPTARVTVATSWEQVSVLRNQLGEDIDICVEPCRRDTFPAIVLASAYLHDIKGVGMNEAVAVCPVDPYVENDYFHSVVKLVTLADEEFAPMMLMGIEPSYPSEKYGYIIPYDHEEISRVIGFREKPGKKAASDYMAKGALWNSGVFAYRLGYVLEKAQCLLGFKKYRNLLEHYQEFERNSFDYAVLENEREIGVLRYRGEWKDIGTWNTLTEVMDEQCIGDAFMDDSCHNVHVINEMCVPIICMGLNDIIVAASPNGILVSDKMASGRIKPYAEQFSSNALYAEETWGESRIVDKDKETIVLKILLNLGHAMSYHSHQRRDETWCVVEGQGEAVLDGKVVIVHQGDQINIPRGMRHTLRAVTTLRIIEIQMGKNISIDDKMEHDLG